MIHRPRNFVLADGEGLNSVSAGFPAVLKTWTSNSVKKPSVDGSAITQPEGCGFGECLRGALWRAGFAARYASCCVKGLNDPPAGDLRELMRLLDCLDGGRLEQAVAEFIAGHQGHGKVADGARRVPGPPGRTLRGPDDVGQLRGCGAGDVPFHQVGRHSSHTFAFAWSQDSQWPDSRPGTSVSAARPARMRG